MNDKIKGYADFISGQIDELSKKTLGSYVKKNVDQQTDLTYQHGSDPEEYETNPENPKKIQKRQAGLDLAVKKLTKEESKPAVDAYANFISKQVNENAISETSDDATTNNSEQDDINSLVEEFIEEMKTAKNTMITLGGKQHPMNKIPMEHYAEFKKKYPGVRTRFRGKRETVGQLQARSGGEKGKENFIHRVHSGDRSGVSVSDTLKKDATHFYAHPSDVEAAGHKLS